MEGEGLWAYIEMVIRNPLYVLKAVILFTELGMMFFASLGLLDYYNRNDAVGQIKQRRSTLKQDIQRWLYSVSLTFPRRKYILYYVPEVIWREIQY